MVSWWGREGRGGEGKRRERWGEEGEDGAFVERVGGKRGGRTS